MHALHLRAGVCASLTATWLGMAGSASAQFIPVSQERAVFTSAYPYARGADGNNWGNDFPVWEFTPSDDFGVYERSFSQDATGTSPDGTATAHGDSSVFQHSFMESGRIGFESRASAGAWLTTTDPLAEGQVTSYGDALFSFDFDLAAPLAVSLSMHSSLSGPQSAYTFELKRDDSVVWDAESVLDPASGQMIATFSRGLTLQPGHYHLTAGLNVSASATQNGQRFNGQGAAGFALVSAVPEPQTWLLMLAGLGLVGGLVRRARTSAAG